jgi:hypothetical protein
MKGKSGFILKIRKVIYNLFSKKLISASNFTDIIFYLKGMFSVVLACLLLILIKFLVDPNVRSNLVNCSIIANLAQMIFPVTIVQTKRQNK